jgi:serine/threonine-protein kinase
VPTRQPKRSASSSSSSSGARLRTTAASTLVAGNVVGGRYRVKRKIASGAMGEVWAGDHVHLKLRVALKALLRGSRADHEVLARFQREAFLLGQIHSDHVARVLDFVTDGKHGPILVMELVEGPSLFDVIQTKRFSIEEAIQLGIDLAKALREIHEANVVHRDVKPANIILAPRRDGRKRAVFVDLGVSRLVPDDEAPDDELLTEITSTNRAVGTVEYMAPEQILGSRNVTATADLYALGAILFRAVSGHHVFGDVHGADLMRMKLSTEAPPLATGRTDRVARGFEDLVARALSVSTEDRFAEADEMLADLLHLRDTARRAAKPTIQFRPPTKTLAERRPIAWWRTKLGRAAAIAVAVASLGTAIVFARRPAPSAATMDLRRCTVVESPRTEAGRVSLSISCEEK